jgi:peptide/nickel transport system permease protein
MEPLTWGEIIGRIFVQFTPVWIALIATFAISIVYKRRLGLYGKLFDSTIGMLGFGIVMFWVFTAAFYGFFDLIATHEPLSQVSGMKNKVPGTPLRGAEEGDYGYYLLGGDNLARDIFSRVIAGSTIVILIAPLATLFAFMVGVTLGLPAGYLSGPGLQRNVTAMIVISAIALMITVAVVFSGGVFNGLITGIALAIFILLVTRTGLDTSLSFLANLVLAFPVILLFYLLVTPEITEVGIPKFMAAVLFLFPIIFCAILIQSRFHTEPGKRNLYWAIVLIPMTYVYLFSISSNGYLVQNDSYAIPALPSMLDPYDAPAGLLVVFVSVVFVNSPTVFRIVRGLALDIRTRDYVAAAQTRGEGAWYIMLWEILPNARGPLIVDFCLRIGYTTILLGTLGFFGLGLPPESPDWGSTINSGRKLLSIYPHSPLPPALALLSLVLGLNLLADGLREESLKD